MKKVCLLTKENQNGNLTFVRDDKGNYVGVDYFTCSSFTKSEILESLSCFQNVSVSGNSLFPLSEINPCNTRALIDLDKIGLVNLCGACPNFVIFGAMPKVQQGKDIKGYLLGATSKNLKEAKSALKDLNGYALYALFVVKDYKMVFAYLGSSDGMARIQKNRAFVTNLSAQQKFVDDEVHRNKLLSYFKRLMT